MASDKTNTIRIELTTEQQRIVKTATDKDVEALELNVEALEERISPTESVGLHFGSIHIDY